MEEKVYRHEFKYLIPSAHIPVLLYRIHGLMGLDPHVGEDGRYQIRSLYFDDHDNSCFYDNENGTDHRSKYRMRIYNGSDARISLERKRSEHGMKQKEICAITRDQAERFLRGVYLRDAAVQEKKLQRLTVPMAAGGLRPVVIVDYTRIPYVYKEGNVRITFDTGISSSNALGSFFDPEIPRRPVMPAGTELLEVKYDAYLPDEIRMALQLDELQYTAFSKYYFCRKLTL